MTEWTPERKEQLKRLWLDGHSASEIARTMGAASRSAVIGIVYRMKLTRSPSAQKASIRLGRKVAGPSINKASPAPKPVKPKLIIAGCGAVLEKPPSEPSPLPPVNVRAWAPLPGSEPVALADLSARHCRWPVDLAGALEQHFCARKLDGGGPYCATHAALSRPKAGAKEYLDQKLGIARRARAA